MSETSIVIDERDEKGRFVAGNSGNGGRNLGARNKLGEDFLNRLYEHWQKNGDLALDACLAESAAAYCKVVASLLPKDVNLLGAQGEQWLEALENFNQIAKAHRAKLIEQKTGDENG